MLDTAGRSCGEKDEMVSIHAIVEGERERKWESGCEEAPLKAAKPCVHFPKLAFGQASWYFDPHMDHDVTIDELKQRVRAFCQERDWDQFHTGKDLAIGLVTEASELLEHFRFKSEREIAEVMAESGRRREIAHELADVLFFILRFSERFGFDLTASLDAKMAINAERYPVEFARGSNRKYTELTQ